MVSLGAGILNNMFAWVAPLVYVYVVYGVFFTSKLGLPIGIILALLVIAIRFLMHRLKTVADEGVAMDKELAREIKFIIPLILGLAVLGVVKYNVAGIVDLLTFTVISNLVAVPFRIISYRFSKRYERDMASLKNTSLLEQIKNKL